jgi:hypothetical protein
LRRNGKNIITLAGRGLGCETCECKQQFLALFQTWQRRQTDCFLRPNVYLRLKQTAEHALFQRMMTLSYALSFLPSWLLRYFFIFSKYIQNGIKRVGMDHMLHFSYVKEIIFCNIMLN